MDKKKILRICEFIFNSICLSGFSAANLSQARKKLFRLDSKAIIKPMRVRGIVRILLFSYSAMTR